MNLKNPVSVSAILGTLVVNALLMGSVSYVFAAGASAPEPAKVCESTSEAQKHSFSFAVVI